MRPLRDLPMETARSLKGVFADIDDTLTTDGRLTPDAYTSLARLQAVGLKVIPITGRPAGWCDHIARMWPVDGVVGENGAFYFRYDHDARRFTKRFFFDEETRRANRERLDAVAAEILETVPGTAMATDQPYREADIAIDFHEDVTPLDGAAIDAVVAVMTEAGMTAKISSIHVNGWFGDYDKLTMTKILMSECFGADLDRDRESYLFAGDSPNDQPMFAYFPNSVGVANLRNFEDRLETRPAYITTHEAGEGFAELASHIIRSSL